MLPVSEANIIQSLGIPAGQADDYVTENIRKYIQICFELSAPCASYVAFSEPGFNRDQALLTLSGETFHLGKIVAAALGKSTRIAIFIGTCGKEVENYSRQLMKEGQTLEGYIVDLIGSEIAENIAEYVHNELEKDMAGMGLKITNRYSPGYCKWPVSDQQQLFRLLGERNCGVSLTDSSLMIPVKSVSGMVGIGEQVENRGYSCSICDADYCIYRDKKSF
ncbi:MAG: vitamin B12 dependent-methionine synthase activation domain-containing protein [Bacteroidales bacterium]